MRALVFCAILVLSAPVQGADLEYMRKVVAEREAKRTRDVRCGKKWVTFPVIGFNLVTRKHGKSDQVTWNDRPHVKTVPKSRVYGLNDKALILIQEKGTTEIVYGVSAPVRDAIIACLN